MEMSSQILTHTYACPQEPEEPPFHSLNPATWGPRDLICAPPEGPAQVSWGREGGERGRPRPSHPSFQTRAAKHHVLSQAHFQDLCRTSPTAAPTLHSPLPQDPHPTHTPLPHPTNPKVYVAFGASGVPPNPHPRAGKLIKIY